ncbi:hypothetical protein ACFIUX_07690 [Oenococcus oeni]|uniref:Uncharacterized protein n=1 Tax=Oenococcus phage phiS11 TaxID=1432847 RepID=V5UTE1_9CAUD|nr:hypothetical protein [Oenococcus oeni]YP_009006580.1 hypothetical protein CF81_gp22 [Oenococcus phage phiS11]AHB80339.1 hypothetical protein [Oenococcus phage phiS11]KGH52419.1 hypothetical protein X325_06780 [Oenococcus oeni S11]MDS0175961.1 hypothetical protein [Oenococcus oeni]OIM37124.1 hypothetical protein ATX68_12895 [Oenococcus oeni]OLQ42054.1 hypothetical protein ATX63_09470 [Oenococcus oeni]
MNFEEIMVQTLANNQNKVQQMRMQAIMDHKQSELMAYALNDPSKMPKAEEAYPFLKQFEKVQDKVPDWKKDQLLLMQQAQRIKAAKS